MENIEEKIIVIVMGPCGCGKSEVGRKLAESVNCKFIDADVFHSDTNVAKMRQGTPLTDEDRIPWLNQVRQEFIKCSEMEKTGKMSVVVGCSALKLVYRNILRGLHLNEGKSLYRVIFALVDCSKEVLESRLKERSGHFMKASMLESQLKTLERPEGEELKNAVTVNGDLCVELVVTQIKDRLSSIY